jgi:precorrin-6Y C5,15-methyltransferase (decarboxylating)
MAQAPWLTIIGIGDNGLESLSAEARAALDAATAVLAPRRVLDSLDLAGREVLDWAAGVGPTVEMLKARRGTPLTVLATGDPMHFGVAATLLRHFVPAEMRILPSPSAFSLAAARLGWPLQDVACISLHGRPVAGIAAHLGQGRRIIALTSDGEGVREAATILSGMGYGGSQFTVLEHMGGPRERIERFTAAEIGERTFADFNTLAVECRRDPETLVDGQTPGLPDEAFIHDGQLTKREVRAVVLSHLRPGAGRRLWDIGAGCGSVAIEWLRMAPNSEAVAVERVAERIAMIKENAKALGVPYLRVLEGAAPAALAGLSRPDAVFIGGGISAPEMFETAWEALDDGGRLVATAVTLEGEGRLAELYFRHGGSLTRIAVSHAEPVGRFSGWKPLMPVTLWSAEKGE